MDYNRAEKEPSMGVFHEAEKVIGLLRFRGKSCQHSEERPTSDSDAPLAPKINCPGNALAREKELTKERGRDPAVMKYP